MRIYGLRYDSPAWCAVSLSESGADRNDSLTSIGGSPPGDGKARIEDTDFYREMEVNRSGNLLEAARLKAGLSQAQLTEAVGIRQTMVSEYENGRRRITEKMAQRFAEVLKIKVERLL